MRKVVGWRHIRSVYFCGICGLLFNPLSVFSVETVGDCLHRGSQMMKVGCWGGHKLCVHLRDLWAAVQPFICGLPWNLWAAVPEVTISAWESALRRGVVIPAHPLALTAARKLDERRRRALPRHSLDAGAGGGAVGVPPTQFAIRDPKVGLYQPVLALAAEAVDEWEDRHRRGRRGGSGHSGRR